MYLDYKSKFTFSITFLVPGREPGTEPAPGLLSEDTAEYIVQYLYLEYYITCTLIITVNVPGANILNFTKQCCIPICFLLSMTILGRAKNQAFTIFCFVILALIYIFF